MKEKKNFYLTCCIAVSFFVYRQRTPTKQTKYEKEQKQNKNTIIVRNNFEILFESKRKEKNLRKIRILSDCLAHSSGDMLEWSAGRNEMPEMLSRVQDMMAPPHNDAP